MDEAIKRSKSIINWTREENLDIMRRDSKTGLKNRPRDLKYKKRVLMRIKRVLNQNRRRYVHDN